MDERENLPAVIAAQAVAVLSEQRGSLVGRGLMALRKDNGALYRQARAVFDRGDGRGWKVAKNPAISSSFKIFQQLANENFGKAYFPLSRLYRTRQEDIERGLKHALHFGQLAFDWCFANQTNQDVELWCDLGEMYELGCGVEKNDEQAVHWFRMAAEQGNAVRQLRLGLLYKWGDGVPQNGELAMFWFHKAAEQGKAVGLVHIGEMYFSGLGVEQSDEQGVYWFRKAAERGDADGQFELGLLYHEGRGVAQDYKEAVKWYRLAAEQGFTEAQCNLGWMYENGNDVPQDHNEAVKLFRMAADQGNTRGQESLRKLGIDWKK